MTGFMNSSHVKRVCGSMNRLVKNPDLKSVHCKIEIRLGSLVSLTLNSMNDCCVDQILYISPGHSAGCSGDILDINVGSILDLVEIISDNFFASIDRRLRHSDNFIKPARSENSRVKRFGVVGGSENEYL